MTRYFSRLPCLATVEAANDVAGDVVPVLHFCSEGAGIVGMAEIDAVAAEAARLEVMAHGLVAAAERAAGP